MKKINLIIFILFAQNIYAQNFEYTIKIEYNHIYNKLNNKIYSYINENKIILIEKNDLKEKIDNDFENNKIKIQNIDTSEDFSLINLDSNLFFIHVEFDNKNNWFMDTLKIIDWKIENTFKKIDTFNCQKATCFFAGRYYNAWFCNDIPIRFGPNKFNGLPGLIIEIMDVENKFIYKLKEFEINQNKVLKNKKYAAFLKNKEFRNYKELKQIQLDYFKKLNSKIKSNFGNRNIEVKDISIKLEESEELD